MRAVFATFALLLAGCAGAPGPSQGTPDPPAPVPPLPPDIEDSGTLPASVDFIATGGPLCQPPQSACARYPFTLAGNATIIAHLGWETPGQDLDLYVLQDGQTVEASNGAAGQEEHLSARLRPGDYEVVASGSLTAGTDYHVWARFYPASDP